MLILSVGIIAPVVVLQALAAPLYVPILFGPGWDGIAEVVSILCLAAIPGVIWSAAANWLRAEGRPQVEFAATLAMTAALIANTVLMAPHDLVALATGYLVVATLTQLGAAARPLASSRRPLAEEPAKTLTTCAAAVALTLPGAARLGRIAAQRRLAYPKG